MRLRPAYSTHQRDSGAVMARAVVGQHGDSHTHLSTVVQPDRISNDAMVRHHEQLDRQRRGAA